MNNDLIRAPEYDLLTTEDKAMICNGCGPGGAIIDLVPDTIYGLSIREACQIHDYDYHVGKTWADKKRADRRFLQNIGTLIRAKKKQFWWMYRLRMSRAKKYYNAVKYFGGSAFKAGKDFEIKDV